MIVNFYIFSSIRPTVLIKNVCIFLLFWFAASKDLEVEIPSEQLGTHSGHRRSFFFRVKTDLEEPKKILDAGKYSYPNYKNTEGKFYYFNT